MPMALSGQTALVDKLLYHTSRPFASRVVGRTHMEALQRDHMAAYLLHHINIAGGRDDLFAGEAITAVHEISGGFLRRAGSLARGTLLAAAQEKAPMVTAEHVRVAATEILLSIGNRDALVCELAQERESLRDALRTRPVPNDPARVAES